MCLWERERKGGERERAGDRYKIKVQTKERNNKPKFVANKDMKNQIKKDVCENKMVVVGKLAITGENRWNHPHVNRPRVVPTCLSPWGMATHWPLEMIKCQTFKIAVTALTRTLSRLVNHLRPLKTQPPRCSFVSSILLAFFPSIVFGNSGFGHFTTDLKRKLKFSQPQNKSIYSGKGEGK